jgi:hypothetical protein
VALIAVTIDPRRPDHDDTIAISRPDVDYTAIDAAPHRWQTGRRSPTRSTSPRSAAEPARQGWSDHSQSHDHTVMR